MRQILLYRIIHLLIHIFYVKPKNNFIRNQVVSGKGTFFHLESMVHNLQKDRKKITIGEYSHVRGNLMVFTHGGEIQIGDYCYVGDGTRIWSAGSIKIGNRVLIAHNVNIHDNNSHPMDKVARHEHAKNLYAGFSPDNMNLNEKPIVIEDDVWIGFNAIILKGIKIGEGAIIGAGTIVNRDVPPNTIAKGNPMEFISNPESR